MPVLTNKGTRPRAPRRRGLATTMARGPSFIQQSYVRGLGSIAITEQSEYLPFDGPLAAQRKTLYQQYAYSAQSCIQRSLEEQGIVDALNVSVGTAPELVVLGDALLRGMVLGVTLFFQSKTFRDPVFNPSGRVFNVDILKAPFADSWLEPVDGAFYHMGSLEAEIHDADRNNELLQYGHVLPISDMYCRSREDLRAFLDSRGSP